VGGSFLSFSSPSARLYHYTKGLRGSGYWRHRRCAKKFAATVTSRPAVGVRRCVPFRFVLVLGTDLGHRGGGRRRRGGGGAPPHKSSLASVRVSIRTWPSSSLPRDPRYEPLLLDLRSSRSHIASIGQVIEGIGRLPPLGPLWLRGLVCQKH
jgi:hypothetical protein